MFALRDVFEEFSEGDAGDEWIALCYAEYRFLESQLLFDIDHATLKVHSCSLEESAAEFFSPLLSMGEERSAKFHLPRADDGEVVPEVLHFGREDLTPLC